jgi:adenylosuccinate lyase
VMAADLHHLVAGLAIPEQDKARLLAMTPASYIGKAAALAKAQAAAISQ